jgi:hypothetical protein
MLVLPNRRKDIGHGRSVHRRAPTYLTDPEVEALLNGPGHSAGRIHDTALPAR